MPAEPNRRPNRDRTSDASSSRRGADKSRGERGRTDPQRSAGARSDSRRSNDQGRGTARSSFVRGGERRNSDERNSSDRRDSERSSSRSGSSRTDTRGAGPRRGASSGRDGGRRFESREPQEAPRKGWGSVARRGANAVRSGSQNSDTSFDEGRSTTPPERNQEEWVRDQDAPRERKDKPREKFQLPEEAINELRGHVGTKRAERLTRYLRDCASAYAAERWSDARKALKVLLAEAPEVSTVKELNAMLLYRTGKYKQAIVALQDAHLANMSFDLYPALMDSHRALKQYDAMDDLWTELRAASPSADVVAEGRIVVAGALGDQGKFQEGIAVLAKAPRPRKKIELHHLRSWYLLADLYDRAGDVGNARSEFKRIADVDADFADVSERLEAL